MTRILLLVAALCLANTVGAHAACKDPPAPKVDWTGCHMGSADLHGADLRGARLSGAYLQHADIRGAKLAGADLSFTNLYKADLSGADLRGAHLDYANLGSADLENATLDGATVQKTVTVFTKLKGAIWIDGRSCTGDSVDTCP
jgi:uncharacterized protein YjbI with pentapeptide repeats